MFWDFGTHVSAWAWVQSLLWRQWRGWYWPLGVPGGPATHAQCQFFMLELGRVVNLLVGFTAGVDFMLLARSPAHFMLWSRSIACFKLWSKPLAFFSVSLSFLKARLLCLSSFLVMFFSVLQCSFPFCSCPLWKWRPCQLGDWLISVLQPRDLRQTLASGGVCSSLLVMLLLARLLCSVLGWLILPRFLGLPSCRAGSRPVGLARFTLVFFVVLGLLCSQLCCSCMI